MPVPAIPIRERFERSCIPEPNTGCWLWLLYANPQGYGQMPVSRAHGRPELAHRMAWRIYRGPIPDGTQVLHKCDMPICVNPDHMFLGTYADNMADMHRKGRSIHHRHPEKATAAIRKAVATSAAKDRSGEKNNSAKLTWADIETIRAVPKYHGALTELAAHYGMSISTMCSIRQNKTWNKA